MTTHSFGLIVLAGCAPCVNAQTAQLHAFASIDGGSTWAKDVVTAPGTIVHVEFRAVLTGATALGFSGIRMQPILSNWETSGGDVSNALTYPGLLNDGTPSSESSYAGRHVPNVIGNTGRLFPFGASSMATVSVPGLLTAFNDPGNTLRFAGSKNVTALTSVEWGVQLSQTPFGITGPLFSTSLNVPIFRYSVTLGLLSTFPRTLTADAPTSLFGLGGIMRWYLNQTGSQIIDLPPLPTSPAMIHVIPAPGGVVLLMACGAIASRRRR